MAAAETVSHSQEEELLNSFRKHVLTSAGASHVSKEEVLNAFHGALERENGRSLLSQRLQVPTIAAAEFDAGPYAAHGTFVATLTSLTIKFQVPKIQLQNTTTWYADFDVAHGDLNGYVYYNNPTTEISHWKQAQVLTALTTCSTPSRTLKAEWWSVITNDPTASFTTNSEKSFPFDIVKTRNTKTNTQWSSY